MEIVPVRSSHIFHVWFLRAIGQFQVCTNGHVHVTCYRNPRTSILIWLSNYPLPSCRNCDYLHLQCSLSAGRQTAIKACSPQTESIWLGKDDTMPNWRSAERIGFLEQPFLTSAQASASSTNPTPHVLSNRIAGFRGRHTANFSLSWTRRGGIKDSMRN